ncbi:MULTISPECIES: LysR family transcriptional regulator [Alteromonadaceae]|uniref:LysR family transcriptional regulator n=1 Tax=Brumicola blandensis TaxID=3075611 RepID=A0AAW8R549_9ALTE|nr:MULTISPECIES: LysR family transcriptional regulator [unclassified Alteromonas]MDT0582960.1 LysR family transcriptional regulator [Alteromonas sp. W409]MDT0628376.1 LysR family transcriptional regulator [Alteromonas sp. W364]
MALHSATLTCLQVFNAIVEQGSFSKASERLNLTQSAVSHRLKQLEEITGVVLIHRTTRYIKITDAGQRLYNQSRLNLAELERTLTSLRSTSAAPLSLTTISSLATKWLLPKLSEYNQEYPSQPLSVLTDDNIIDLKYEGIDAAIRLTDVNDPSLHMSFISDEWVFPVASDVIAKDRELIDCPKKLFDFPRLVDVIAERGTDESSWKGWLLSQGLSFPNSQMEQNFNRTDIALQATAAGQGVAIARASLVETDMLEMKLFKQVGRAVKMKYSYYFVCPHEKAENPEIINLKNWISKELKTSVSRVKQQLIY